MSIGGFVDKLIMFGLGFYLLYLYKFKKDKLGNKTRLALWAGIGLIGTAAINLLVSAAR